MSWTNKVGSKSHLAAGQLAEVRLQVLPYHCVNGHQAEDASFSHAALRVVVALSKQAKRA